MVTRDQQAANLRTALSAADRPDALACYSYHTLYLARLAAGDLGLRIGVDLGLMCFAKPGDAELERPYTVCALDFPALGREAVAMAWRRIETGKSQEQVLIPEPLLARGTTDRGA